MRSLTPALLLLIACSGAVETPPLVTPDSLPPPAQGAFYHAVFPGDTTGDENTITLARLVEYEQASGKTAAWVYFSHEWGVDRRFPGGTVAWIHAHGSLPYIRLMLRTTTEQNVAEPVFTVDRILAGDFDADLRTWGRAARQSGIPILAEFGTEMNGDWFSWNGSWNGGPATSGYGDPGLADGPERFRDAYRHIITVIRQAGGTNVAWVFHVNDADYPAVGWNAFENYYPGPDYITWLGVSVYGAQTPQDTEWPRFRTDLDAVYPRLTALAPGMPIVLAEFGVASGNPLGNQAAWADSALVDLLGHRWPAVIGCSWWNEGWPNDDVPAHATSMRLQENPPLAAAFNARLAAAPDVRGHYP
jgi:hypothetical protein